MTTKPFVTQHGIEIGGNAFIANSIISVDSVQLDLDNPIADLAMGQLSWNVDSNTASVGLGVSSLELGQEEHIYIKNQSGNTISKGNTVMFAGTLGSSGRILGAPAVMDGTYPSSYFIGIAKHDIVDGDDGYVTTFGKIDQVDTSMFSEGDILYADPASAGSLSNTAPVSPNNYVTAAAVINSDATNGVLFVRPTYEGTIADKEDVYIDNIQDGEALTWSAANSRFENSTAGSELELYAENPSSPTAPSATGTNAVAIGTEAIAAGTESVALGPSYASAETAFAASIRTNSSSYGATGTHSVAIGSYAKATNVYGVAIGPSSQSRGDYAVAIGNQPYATTRGVCIGSDSFALATSSFAFGDRAKSEIVYKFTYAGGRFSSNGDAQTGTFVLRSDTTDATPEALTTNNSTPGTTNQIILPNNSAYSFSGTIIARESATDGSDYASWEIKGALLRDANAASTVLGNGIVNKLYSTAGASAWVIALTADTTNGGLKIEVTGAAATNIRWVATVHTSEVTYA